MLNHQCFKCLNKIFIFLNFNLVNAVTTGSFKKNGDVPAQQLVEYDDNSYGNFESTTKSDEASEYVSTNDSQVFGILKSKELFFDLGSECEFIDCTLFDSEEDSETNSRDNHSHVIDSNDDCKCCSEDKSDYKFLYSLGTGSKDDHLYSFDPDFQDNREYSSA